MGPTPGARFIGITGRTVMVTGAARGIGRGIADAFVDQGANVVALDREWPREQRPLTDRLRVAADVTVPAEVEAAFAACEERWGAVSILVSNAGIFATGDITTLEHATWQRILEVNTTGAFNVVRRAVPGMRAAGHGRIVAISSNAAKMGGVTSAPAYGASKAATDTLIRSLAVSEARFGITANSVAAGLIDAPMLAQAGLLERGPSLVPVGRLGTPVDVSYAVLFLSSDEAGFINGEVMDVNGGFYID